jgi:hypothetical protein
MVGFYPVITMLTTPVRLAQTLWACRTLADGKHWHYYSHFNPHRALSSLFYWTGALNIYRYGRSGVTPYQGLGKTRLTYGFHYSLPSLYAYWMAGAVVLLFGMFVWWASHWLWLQGSDGQWIWVMTILFLTLSSTLFYVNIFALQNYNVLGWMFFPTALYGWLTGHWAIACLALLGASFGSFTVVVISGMLAVVFSIETGSFMGVLTVIPAFLKLSTHFWANISPRDICSIWANTAKFIGLAKRKVKYKRSKIQFGPRKIYLWLLCVQYVAALSYYYEEIPILLVSGIMIWLVNDVLVRFADEQTFLMLVISLGTATLLQKDGFNIGIGISYYLFASPIPMFLRFPSQACLSIVPRYKPVNILPVLEGLKDFLMPVKEDQKVLMALNDPKERYEALFDGYFVLLEPLVYTASQKKILMIPDWRAVSELNCEGDPGYWGCGIKEVTDNMEQLDCRYVVVYQRDRKQLGPEWHEAGFEVMSHFSWADYEHLFKECRPYEGPIPDWWLLKNVR